MNEDNLKCLLRSAFPQSDNRKPSHDLWPSVVERIQAPFKWSWVDLSTAAGVVTGITIVLVMLPKSLLLLAYNL